MLGIGLHKFVLLRKHTPGTLEVICTVAIMLMQSWIWNCLGDTSLAVSMSVLTERFNGKKANSEHREHYRLGDTPLVVSRSVLTERFNGKKTHSEHREHWFMRLGVWLNTKEDE